MPPFPRARRDAVAPTAEIRFFTNASNQASLDLHAALGFIETGRAAKYLSEPFDGGVGYSCVLIPLGVGL